MFLALAKDKIIPYLLEHPLKDGVLIFYGSGGIGNSH
jgi:hypothetical protein